MAASALGFSAMAVLVKLAAVRLPTGEVMLARAAVSLLFSYVLVRRAGLAPLGTARGALLLRGLIGTASIAFYYLSLARLSLVDAVMVQNTAPLFTAVLAWWLLGERLGWAGAAAIALGLTGVALVSTPLAAPADVLGIAAALSAALFAALAFVTVRRLARTEHPLVIVLYFPLVATPIALPWAAANFVCPTLREWLLLFGIGATTQIGQVFMTLGLSVERAGRATAVSYLQVCFAIVWQLVVFGDQPRWWTIVGGSLIVAGTIAISANPERPKIAR